MTTKQKKTIFSSHNNSSHYASKCKIVSKAVDSFVTNKLVLKQNQQQQKQQKNRIRMNAQTRTEGIKIFHFRKHF